MNNYLVVDIKGTSGSFAFFIQGTMNEAELLVIGFQSRLLREGSKLRTFIETILGRPLTQEELCGFDLLSLIGKEFQFEGDLIPT